MISRKPVLGTGQNPRTLTGRHGKTATLDDVAALAEVSAKTVSRVVNAEGGVHRDTRERVMRAIELLDYRPNLSARVLAGDRSFLIGVFCGKPGSYLADFQSGATERCRESGYHVMVEEWDRDDPKAIRHVTSLLRQLRLDGAILLPPISDDRLMCNTLRDAGIPTVRIAPREAAVDSPSIGINDYLAARQLTAHLLGLGHRRIGFIMGKPGHGATEQRYRGFCDEMQEQGAPVEASLIETGNFVFADGVACAQRMLRNPSPPSAIFASNDDTAAAVISVAHQMGLELPGELSVVGFDDAPIATMIWPLLTTIRQPVTEIAREAVGLIIDHLPRRSSWPTPVPDIVLDFEFLARDSTAPPRTSAPRISAPPRAALPR